MEKVEKIKIISLRELITETLLVYKNNWQKFGYLLILPLILSFILSLASYFVNFYISELNLVIILSIGFLYFLFFVGFLVLYLFSYIAQFLLLKDLEETEIGFKDIKDWYLKAKPYFWRVVMISLVFSILAILGLILLIIPRSYFYGFLCFCGLLWYFGRSIIRKFF